MQFGVFDHMDASGEPLAQLFENRLKLAEAYDRLGFHTLHVAEHHSTPLGMSPAPSGVPPDLRHRAHLQLVLR
jgi:alkanesulfonate monooxygenase SsuD/methylene tetrahydromethanopterin reductase-like flavin-dependent oxidoreductase (luciferase family)